MNYRRDIDGLRCLAILPVLFFHFGIGFFDGGYVGVDVFFVISGFLITSLIRQDILAGKFTYMGFYERRFRRILPALFAVLFVTAAVGWFVLTPGNMASFGAEVYNSTYFSTNFLYFRKDGYFDGASNLRLLLHTWSLSVEEQFYLIVPFLVGLAVGRKDRPDAWRPTWIFLALTALSLAVSVISVWKFPSAAYYLLPSRAWELLCGSLLALGHAPRVQSVVVRQAAGMAGLLLLAGSVVFYSSLTAFPGVAAIPPCLGAALLIWVGMEPGAPPVLASRALSWGPCVAVGKISYSLYLWHWPVLVMFRHYRLTDPDDGEALLLIGLSVVLAVLSYRLIEQPFRVRKGPRAQRAFLLGCVAVMVALFVFGKESRSNGGFAERYTPEASRYASYSVSMDPRHHLCRNRTADQVKAGDLCRYGEERPGAPDFAVWGDSHAESMLPAFDALARERDVWGMQLSFGACPPLLGVTVESHMRGSLPCHELNAAALEQFEKSGVKTVIIIARWAMYAEPFPKLGTDARVNKELKLSDDKTVKTGWAENREVIARGLERTVDALRRLGISVYVTEPIPETWFEVPHALAVATMTGRDRRELEIPEAAMEGRQAWIKSQLSGLQQRGLITVLPTHPLLCGNGRCMVERNGESLYRDGTHVSIPGAMLLSTAVAPAIPTRR